MLRSLYVGGLPRVTASAATSAWALTSQVRLRALFQLFAQFWSHIINLRPPVRLDPHGGRALCDAGNSSEEGLKDMKGNFTCRLFL